MRSLQLLAVLLLLTCILKMPVECECVCICACVCEGLVFLLSLDSFSAKSGTWLYCLKCKEVVGTLHFMSSNCFRPSILQSHRLTVISFLSCSLLFLAKVTLGHFLSSFRQNFWAVLEEGSLYGLQFSSVLGTLSPFYHCRESLRGLEAATDNSGVCMHIGCPQFARQELTHRLAFQHPVRPQTCH